MNRKIIWPKGLIVAWMMSVPFFFSCRTLHYFQADVKPEIQKEKRVASLPATLRETSGLEYYHGRLWSFNDSGGDPVLYAFLPRNPAETMITYPVIGAVNVDWEDIAYDKGYFYISDAGNNAGARDTLVIYKVNVDTTVGNAGVSSVITLSYPGKTPLYSNCRKNPFDSEALTVINDSLWLFTKNWQDESSCIYTYPENGGFYYQKPGSCLQDAGMLVTGADFDENANKLWLIGYHHFIPVIRAYSLENEGRLIPVLRIKLGNRFGLQTEAIVCAGDGYIYFSYEKSKRKQGIFRMKNPFPDAR